MFERFTEKAIKVIMMAQEESRRMGHNFVGTEQILLGLCGEGTGIAARVLRAHNIKLKDLRVTVLAIIDKGSCNVPVQIPFTPRAKKLLEAGWNIARDMEQTYIGTEHLLLGLLEVDGAVAKQVLSKHNVDLEKIRIDVIDFVQTANKQQSLASANPAHASVQDQSDPLVESSVPIKSQALVRSVKGPVEKSNVADLFSESAIIAMQLAQQEARRVGSMKLELQHLLLGILAEGSSESARLLSGQSIALEELRLATTQEGVEKPSEYASLDFELSKQVFAAVEMASIVARKYGSAPITPEHLLFTLLSYEESRAVKGLETLGVNIELFVDKLRTVMQRPSTAIADFDKQNFESMFGPNYSSIYDRLSKESIRSILLGFRVAKAFSHQVLEPSHILLGLLCEQTATVVAVSNERDFDLYRLTHRISRLIAKPVSEPKPVTAKLLADYALLAARDFADVCNCDFIEPDHMLFGVLNNDSCLNLLQSLKIDFKQFREVAFDIIKANNPTFFTANHPVQVDDTDRYLVRMNAATIKRVFDAVNDAKDKKPELPFTVADGETGATINLSTRSIEVVTLALRRAHALGHSFVSTEFLLLGLFSVSGGAARQALFDQGANEDLMLMVVERLLGTGPGATELPVPSTSNAKEALKLAVEQSILFSSVMVQPEHILLGLLAIKDSNAFRILESLDIDPQAVRNRLLCSITPVKPTAPVGINSTSQQGFRGLPSSSKAVSEPEIPPTTMVEHVIVLATEEAHRLGHKEVDSDHILLGLMAEADGLASLALHVWDVKLKELRQESTGMPGREKCETFPESKCGSKVNELILAARNLARAAKLTYVGTDHVLLAILADEDCSGLKVLRNLSIDVERLRKTLMNASSPPPDYAKFSALVPLSKQHGFERFSEEAIKALNFAKEEAARLCHSVIDSQFLLLGICDERLNKGAERLRKIGISLDDLRFEIEHLSGFGEASAVSEIVFSERSLRAMQNAFDKVVSEGLEVVRPEHLFGSIVVEDSGPVFSLMKQFNVSIERIRANTPLKLRSRKRDSGSDSAREKVASLIGFRHSSICKLLSDSSVHVILRAVLEASKLSHNRILPYHLLLALLQEGDVIAVKASSIANISLDQLREGVRIVSDVDVPGSLPIEVSVLAEEVLVAARVTAELCKSITIKPDHLLVGLLKDDSCIALFDHLNYDYKDYKEITLLLLKTSFPDLFVQEKAKEVVSLSQDGAVTPPFFKLTDADIDSLFGRTAGTPDKLAMRIFTSTAQSAIRLAILEARRLGLVQVGTDHLLVGILSGEDSVAATAMEALGITRVTLSAAIEREFGRGSGSSLEDLPFSKNAIVAFEKAFECAQSFGVAEIGTDQLLIGIISVQKILNRGSFSREDCAGVTILRSLGIDLGYLRQLVLKRMAVPRRPEIKSGDITVNNKIESRPSLQSKSFSYSAATISRFENFAADSLKAILIAHDEARESQLSFVGTAQILLALVLEPEGKAGVILQRLGVTEECVRADIDRFVRTGQANLFGAEPYTSDAIGVFHMARSGAAFVAGKVRTEHLLLGMITNPKYLGSIIIERAGVDIAKLQQIMSEEQAAISELVARAVDTNQTADMLRASLPEVDYEQALIPPLDPDSESISHWHAIKRRFTANLHTVIDGAKADSCNRNNGIVDAPQLLFALLNLPTNSCAYHLTTLNIDRFTLRNRLDHLLQGTRPSSPSAFVGFSALADQLLLRAFQLSIFEGGGWVQTKHLLLALIESNDEKFFPFLVALQLRSDEVVGGYSLMPPKIAEPTHASRLLVNGLSQANFKVTATAERAMKFAASEARQMGHNFVGTEQIMLGLIAAGDGVAGQVLLAYGLSLTDVRRRVRAIIGLGSGNVADEVPFTPRTQRMLDLSLCESQRLQHDEIGTGHILLGLLREGHGVAARVLTEMGLSLDKLIEVTEARLLEDAAKKCSSIGVNDDAASDQAYEL